MFSNPKFKLGDLVQKRTGSNWHGRIVGMYSTKLTPEGYAVESMYEVGSVQIYPASALELIVTQCPQEIEMEKDDALNTLAKVFHNGEEMEGEDGMVMVVDLALWNEGCEAIEALIGGEDDIDKT